MDVQKFIIESLSKSPFNIKYSLNTLSSLKSHELLQLLYNVLIEISGQSKEDTGIEREEPDKIAIGILDTLRILNYKLPVGMDPINFRDGLIAGVSHVIQGVLYWLLSNVESISERAYLAKFLVKLEIPTDFIGNPEIAHLYQQYQQLMDKFKEVHKENCALKSTNKITINELRSDCEAIEKEKEIVSNRLQQLNLKTDGIANKDSILKAAQDLGTQRDRKSNLQHQLEEESSIVQNVNYRIIRTSKHLQDIRDNYPQLSSED